MFQSQIKRFNQLSEDPEVIKIIAKAGEQGRITGILNYYNELYPEFNHVFKQIIKEIDQ